MTADRPWGLSENVRIVREDVVELNSGHVHRYADATTHAYDLQICITKPRCLFPYRWRWNNFFDWTYVEKEPRLRKGRSA